MTTEASERRFLQKRPGLVLFLWSCLVAPVSLAGSRAPWETGLKPSENKGRRLTLRETLQAVVARQEALRLE